MVILTLEFIVESILAFLNNKSSKKSIPVELDGIYDEERYQKSQAYQTEVSKFSRFTSSISFLVSFLAIALGWFGWLDNYLRELSPFNMVTTLLFFAILFIVNDLITIPFVLYKNFVVEEKFGFNKMTLKTFLLDKLKSYVLTFLIGGLLLSALIYLVESIGMNFWVYFWGIMVAFMLFANLFYTSLILPLFNKLTPLENGALKQSIKNYCEKVNFPMTNIFVMDGSKRSSKGNAFFSGFGKKKKVVLFDTLIENHSVEELTAVFAHEVGHYKKKHIIQSTFFSILLTGLMLFLFSRMVFSSEVSWAMGGQTTALHLNILAFGILYTPISTLFGIIGSVISRKNEYEADAFAKETYDGQPLIDSLKKMTSDHLSNLTPHPAYVFVHYSHPPLKERVKALG